MWICARCGTQAQKIEVCSGCGCLMTLPNQRPKEDKFQFVLIAYLLRGGVETFGPFASVSEADQWWDKTAADQPKFGWKDYEVVLMENPNDRET